MLDITVNRNYVNSSPFVPCGIKEISEMSYYCKILINIHSLFWVWLCVCLLFLCCSLKSSGHNTILYILRKQRVLFSTLRGSLVCPLALNVQRRTLYTLQQRICFSENALNADHSRTLKEPPNTHTHLTNTQVKQWFLADMRFFCIAITKMEITIYHLVCMYWIESHLFIFTARCHWINQTAF